MDDNLKASLLCAWALLWMSLLLGAATSRPLRRSGLRAWQQTRNNYRRAKAWQRHHVAKLVKVSCYLLYHLITLLRKRNELPALPIRLLANAMWNSVSFFWYLGIPTLWGAWHLHISMFFYWLLARGLFSEFIYRRSLRQQQRSVVVSDADASPELPVTDNACAEDRITGENPPGM